MRWVTLLLPENPYLILCLKEISKLSIDFRWSDLSQPLHDSVIGPQLDRLLPALNVRRKAALPQTVGIESVNKNNRKTKVIISFFLSCRLNVQFKFKRVGLVTENVYTTTISQFSITSHPNGLELGISGQWQSVKVSSVQVFGHEFH